MGKIKVEKYDSLLKQGSQLRVDVSTESVGLHELQAQESRLSLMIDRAKSTLSDMRLRVSDSEEAEKISSAIKLLHNNNPDIIVDGQIQSDFALNKEMLKSRFPFSNLNGRKVNTLIFPNLDSANISYKIIKELDDAISIGPILIGLNKPVHILQLGASVEEIVNMAAISAIDSQRRKIRKK